MRAIRHPFSLQRQLSALVLGRERKQRLRISRLLICNLVYLLCLGVSLYSISQGMAQARSIDYLFAYIAVGQGMFYLLLRSGLSLRFEDPSLTLPQSIFSIGAIAIAYWSVGPARGAVLMLLPLVFAFGMLALRPLQTALLGFGTVVILALLMLGLAHIQPERFNPQLETIFFLLSTIILLTMVWVAKQIWNLRERMRQQRSELADALQRVEELAVRDELTGLHNRRHVQSVLQHQLLLQQRTRAPFCMALIDLDHFKQINDRHGHQVGDEVLRGFAAQACKVLRETDLFGRWGGEEFVLLMPATHAEEAIRAVERLRHAMLDFAPSAKRPALRIRFSAGIAEIHRGDSAEQLLACADAALYRAKAAGRNTSQVYEGRPGVLAS